MKLSDPFVQRVGLAKIIGLVIGILGFWFIARTMPNAYATLPWAFLLLSVTIGGIVGSIGYYGSVPVFGFTLSPLFRGGLIGTWMTLTCILFAWPALEPALNGYLGLPDWLTHPVWILVDGFVIGAVIDLAISRVYGRTLLPRES